MKWAERRGSTFSRCFAHRRTTLVRATKFVSTTTIETRAWEHRRHAAMAHLSLRQSAASWLAKDPDPESRAHLQAILDGGKHEALAQAFGQRLAFGTAGLRGLMGVGPNNMNVRARGVGHGCEPVIHHLTFDSPSSSERQRPAWPTLCARRRGRKAPANEL